MRRPCLVLALVAALGCVSPSRGPDQDVPPTEGQALEHLQSLIALVEAGHAGSICDLGGPLCKDFVEPFDAARVPTTRPLLLEVRTIPAVAVGEGKWRGSYVRIEVCGVDGRGDPYRSEMMVYWNRGRIVSTQPAYWLGMIIADDPVVGAPEPPIVCPAT